MSDMESESYAICTQVLRVNFVVNFYRLEIAGYLADSSRTVLYIRLHYFPLLLVYVCEYRHIHTC